jgi:hypothetical protein
VNSRAFVMQCHPERSEGGEVALRLLRFAQDDT